MKKSKLEIRVGARGWQYSDWVGEFYPDDLPEDWRFSFYSNEFQTILVPYETLVRSEVDDWVDWVEDTQKNFSFYVEIFETASWIDVKPYLEALGAQLKGLVVVVEELKDVNALASLIKHLKTVAPVCIQKLGNTVSERDMHTLQTCHEVNECWDGDSETPVWSYGEAAVLLCDVNEQNTPDKMRQLIETGMEYAGKCDAIALFFTGTAPKMSDMRTARTITDLLV
ncbi:hypothetical protein [Kaarinaea lacus]